MPRSSAGSTSRSGRKSEPQTWKGFWRTDACCLHALVLAPSVDLRRIQAAEKRAEGYSKSSNDHRALVDADGHQKEEEAAGGHFGEEIFNKGTSRRIWAELYKD